MHFASTSFAEAGTVVLGERRPFAMIEICTSSMDLDDCEMYKILVRYDGPPQGNIIRLGSKTFVGEPVLIDVVDRISQDIGFPGTERFADTVCRLPMSMLRKRVDVIEASVRSALEDEHLAAPDYTNLVRYPARLAIVESLAARIQKPGLTAGLTGPIPDEAEYEKQSREIAAEAQAAVAGLSGLIAAQHVLLSRRQADDAAAFQRVVTLIGAAILVPGLVAAIFGANVKFAGSNTAAAFWAMLLFMVAGGVGSFALLRSMEARVWSRLATRLRLPVLTELPEGLRIGLTGGLALMACLAGLMILQYA